MSEKIKEVNEIQTSETKPTEPIKYTLTETLNSIFSSETLFMGNYTVSQNQLEKDKGIVKKFKVSVKVGDMTVKDLIGFAMRTLWIREQNKIRKSWSNYNHSNDYTIELDSEQTIEKKTKKLTEKDIVAGAKLKLFAMYHSAPAEMRKSLTQVYAFTLEISEGTFLAEYTNWKDLARVNVTKEESK
jgi:hypothetical protein